MVRSIIDRIVECFRIRKPTEDYNKLFSAVCQGVECSKTFDLTKNDCQDSDTGNTVPTLYPGMEPTNNVDRSCSIEDLIRAIRIQSALGALVGLLSFTLVVVIIGWARTYYLMMRGRGEMGQNQHQIR